MEQALGHRQQALHERLSGNRRGCGRVADQAGPDVAWFGQLAGGNRPQSDKAINLPVQNIALTVNGVHLLENLVLEDLAKARAYEFAFVMQPLKLQGATGSTVAPTAIR